MKLLTNPPKWLVALVTFIGTAICGVALNYSEFRKASIDRNTAAAERTIASSADLKPILDKFIALATGKGQVATDDRNKARLSVRLAYDQAEDVRNRLGGLDAEFDAYGASLVALLEGIDHVTGPLDGKQFIVALANYFVADENWRKAVQRKQNSYFSSLRM